MSDPGIWQPIQSINFGSFGISGTMASMGEWAQQTLGFSPYQWQLEAAAVILHRKQDEMVIARTGDGKSAVYQMLVSTGKTMIVISPILGLIGEQAAYMRSKGISAVGITAETLHENKNLWKEVERGTYQSVFLSPEQLLDPSSHFWHKMINCKTNHFLRNLAAIVVDEAHIVWKWGESGFRKDYKNIGDLRTYLPTVPFLLMSATLSPNVKTYLHTTLKMMSPTVVSQRTIRRANVRLVCARVRAANGCWSDLDFLIPAGGGLEDATTIPKTMVFVDNRNSAQYIANYLRSRLDSSLTTEQRVDRIKVYTAALEIATRDVIMAEFRAGKTRVLVCTDAAGMGMDIPDVQICIQYRIGTGNSASLSLADIYQRLGRCARDQSIDGLAIVFVEGKFLLPEDIVEAEDANPRYQLYKMGASFDDRHKVREFVQSMFSKDKGDTPYAYLDPCICWLVNTYGCRARAILSVFEDPETYSGSDAACGCDNCIFPARGSDGDTERVFRQADAATMNLMHGFTMSRSIRYEASPAYRSDVIEAKVAVLTQRRQLAATTVTMVSKELKAETIAALGRLRQSIFEAGEGERYNITPEMIFPDKFIDKLAAKSRSIGSVGAVETCLGKGFDIGSSALADYTTDLVDTIDLAVSQFDQREREREAAAEVARQAAVAAARLAQLEYDRVQERARVEGAAAAAAAAELARPPTPPPVPKKTRTKGAPRAPRRSKYDVPHKPMSEFDMTTEAGRKAWQQQEEFEQSQAEWQADQLAHAAQRARETDRRKSRKAIAEQIVKQEKSKQKKVEASQKAPTKKQPGRRKKAALNEDVEMPDA